MECPSEKYCCQNNACELYGQRGKGNLRFQGWSGKGKRIRLIFCRKCGKLFSERRGTALEETRLPAEKFISVLEHLGAGCGIRVTAGLTKVGKDTVCRIAKKAGKHARLLHDELVAFSPSHP
jgi:transposase-like protein